MIKPDIKKLVLLNLPYLFAFYFVDKVAVVFRMDSRDRDDRQAERWLFQLRFSIR